MSWRSQKKKIIVTNKISHANTKLLKLKLVSRNSKIRKRKTIIQPRLMYTSEILSITKNQEEVLGVVKGR